MATDKHGDPLISEFGRLTPNDILHRLDPRIKRRVDLLHDVYNEYIAHFSGVYLNRRLLLVTVESCYCDIYRLKFFRPVDWIDAHKKAAYTMKWIARIRPIQIHSGSKITTATLMANAYFAVMSGLTLLEIKEGRDNEKWWGRYIRNLTYILYYHSVSVEQLSSEMFLLEQNQLKA